MEKLTRREKEVLSLLAAGRRPIEVAKTLNISRRTVQAHMNNARYKTGARTTIELAAKVSAEIEQKARS
jgi:DNA-binding CsgD family transcriptional regulator